MYAICNICAPLILLVLSRMGGALNDVKICTTIDCPNDHIEVVDNLDGAVHRYSKNAANFQEAKASPSKAAPQGIAGYQLHQDARAPGLRNSKEPQGQGGIRMHQGREDTARMHHASNNHKPNQQARVSVLGDTGKVNQGFELQHQPHVQNHPNLQKTSTAKPQQHLNHRPTQETMQSNQGHRKIMSNSGLSESTRITSSTVVKEQPNSSEREDAVEDGIFWSASVENAIPPGLSDVVTESWKKRTRELQVVKVENASLEKCGSDMNRHVVFNDGTTACARYRHPMVQFVLGDLYCYYFARMLGMQNVPAVVLSHVSNDSSSQWSSVTGDIHRAGWKDDTLVSFSLWIDDIGKTDLPEIMYENQRETIYPNTPGMADLNMTQLVELAQYSDLMIFDYITLHLDRMTIRKNAVEYYGQDWLYKGEVHNLAKHKANGGLWFIDNENGIFSSYGVVYSRSNKDHMQAFHEELLRSFCIFRRSTYDKMHDLARLDDPLELLHKTVHENEPVLEAVARKKPITVDHLKERFKMRLANVVHWMDNCQSRSSG